MYLACSQVQDYTVGSLVACLSQTWLPQEEIVVMWAHPLLLLVLCFCDQQVEKALRNKVGFLQAQVDELQHKQVELLAQKQQMQVRCST